MGSKHDSSSNSQCIGKHILSTIHQFIKFYKAQDEFENIAPVLNAWNSEIEQLRDGKCNA